MRLQPIHSLPDLVVAGLAVGRFCHCFTLLGGVRGIFACLAIRQIVMGARGSWSFSLLNMCRHIKVGLSHSSLVSFMRSPTFLAPVGINQRVLDPSSLNSDPCGLGLLISQVVFATSGRSTTLDSLTS
jgi:hypothetical protein